MSAIVLIAASAGGLDPVRRIVATLPEPCAVPVFVVKHVGAQRSILPPQLSRRGIPASFAEDGASVEPGPGQADVALADQSAAAAVSSGAVGSDAGTGS
jgi:two-component system chemotaxis response regulator CheB